MSLMCHSDMCRQVLRAEMNMVLLGHSLVLLLQTAEQEAAAGGRGSRALRGDAFRLLDELMSTAREGSTVRTAVAELSTQTSLSFSLSHRWTTQTPWRFSCRASSAACARQSTSPPWTRRGCVA